MRSEKINNERRSLSFVSSLETPANYVAGAQIHHYRRKPFLSSILIVLGPNHPTPIRIFLVTATWKGIPTTVSYYSDLARSSIVHISIPLDDGSRHALPIGGQATIIMSTNFGTTQKGRVPYVLIRSWCFLLLWSVMRGGFFTLLDNDLQRAEKTKRLHQPVTFFFCKTENEDLWGQRAQ